MIGTLPLVKCMSGMPVAPGVACTLTPTKRFPDAYRAFGDSCGFRSIKAFAEPQWAARSTIVVDETQQYSAAEMERMMKVQDVLLKAMAKKITWWAAAEILGVTDRTMRRWRERLEEDGYSGLADRRKGKPSAKRIPLATVEKVLRAVSRRRTST